MQSPIIISTIQLAVATHFKIAPSTMQSHSRLRRISRPRQIAMFLSRELTSRTLPEIGDHFGNRHHTTILSGIRRISSLRLSNPELAHSLSIIRQELTNGK